jgi:hypothetical protein
MRARDAVSREPPATRLVPCVLPGGPSAAPGTRHLHVLLSNVIHLHLTIAMLPCGQIVMFLTQYPRAPPPAAPRARVRLCDSETREHGESDCPRDGLFRDAEDSLEADGNGYGAFAYAGRGFHRGRRLERALT